MGQFKFYHLEREITTQAEDADISLSYEHNFNLGMQISLKRTLLTVPWYKQSVA